MSRDIGRQLRSRILNSYNESRGHQKRQERERGEDGGRVYARKTRDTYAATVTRFGNWVREQEGRKCSMERARELAPRWLEQERDRGQSAPTLKQERSALAKAFGCRGEDILERLPTRFSGAITRGRTETERAHRAAERCRDDMEIARAFGPRHFCECPHVTRESCRWGEDGHIQYIHIPQGKGGKERDAFVLPGAGRDILEERWRAAEPGECLFNMHATMGANIHGCRADYAARAYAYALEHDMGDGREYHPRDGSGSHWDKGALNAVSHWMGHGDNRYQTIYYNYLSYGS